MQYYPFDSSKKLYKSVYGAVASGESLTLRLLLHIDAHCHNAYLLLHSDGESTIREIELTPGEYLDSYRFYDCTVTPDEGLYWYCFRYTSNYGEFFVTKIDNLGIVSRDGSEWQLTVYDRDFKTPDWIKGGIIYQIFPDRFCNSGMPKQGIPSDRYIVNDWRKQPEYRQNNGVCSLGNDYYGGDLKGIIEKLGYLEALGVNCIYLNPVFEAHSNHRYNTADYMKIDPSLGTDRDFTALCLKAKEHGIHIILDGVFSHTGDDSIYFNRKCRYDSIGAFNSTDSPYYSWYRFRRWPEDYHAWWGVPSLPELDETNCDFSQFITGENGVLRHWLRLGADGWRLDVADELPDEFIDKIRTAVKAEKPDAYLLGEVWEDATNKISYGVRRRYLRGKQLDSVMNYPFSEAIISFVLSGDAAAFLRKINDIAENYPPAALHTLMNHIGTHDTARILTRLGSSDKIPDGRSQQSQFCLTSDEYQLAKRRLKIAVVLQFTLPGVPSVYYGDETGMQGCGDPFCRSAYNWETPDGELQSFYTFIGKLRRDSSVFKDGDFLPFYSDSGCVAFMREKSGSCVITAVNCKSGEQVIDLPAEFVPHSTLYGIPPENGKLKICSESFCILNGMLTNKATI